MWITVMNLIFLIAITVLFLISVIGYRAVCQEKRSWKEIESKAECSGISELND